jgi:diguanylate cyclase
MPERDRVAVTATSGIACPSRSTTITEISPAAALVGTSAASVKQVAIINLQSAKWVAYRPPLAKESCRLDLIWTMGISVPILRSLRTRILALVLGLVTLVVAAMVTAIAVKARAEVERQVAVQLSSAADTAREVLKFRGSRLTGAVELLTKDFGFREAVASGDKPTLISAIENQRARINADLVIVLTQEGHPLVSTLGALTANTEHDLQDLITNDPDSETLQLYRLIDGRPYQLVLAPILAPEPIGWAAIGFALDDAVASEMSRLLGVDVSFVADGDHNPLYVASSMNQPGQRQALTANSIPDSTPTLITAGSEKILVWSKSIRSANGPLALVLQRSLSSALRPYNEVRDSTFAIGPILLAVALVLAVLLARSATKPVEELTAAAERLEAGNYSTEVPLPSTSELKHLANAFNAMRAAVADREATIHYQASHDVLTHLQTRARITPILDEMLIQAHLKKQSVAIYLVEIQQLESIIGSFGHGAADQVLSEVARRLMALEHRKDRLGHIGTGRFLILLDSIDPSMVEYQAERMLERLRASFDYSGVSFQLDIRIGVVVFPVDGAQSAELLQRVDLALIRAKETGATVGAYLPGDDTSHRHRLTILGELRQAIAANELELHYQPKVEARTNRLVGCEALVRWRHPTKGFIPPADFIPDAERTGAIRALTLWVAARAFRDLKSWHDAGSKIDVSINVSPLDLADPSFVDSIRSLLVHTGADATGVVFEVTESGAMKDLAVTLRMMEQLQVFGIRFSIDDFGTGYSSLAHLKRLPVDEVKIDRSFIKELEARSDDDLIVRSTINLGHAMNLKVVAEGVELLSSWEALRRLGCDLIQGYFISKPLPMQEFTAWMDSRRVSSQVSDRAENHLHGDSERLRAT